MGRKTLKVLSTGNKGGNLSLNNYAAENRVAYMRTPINKMAISISVRQLEESIYKSKDELLIQRKHPYSSRKNSPINIPRRSSFEFSQKNGYIQTKYKWKTGKYTYEVRWHTKTPESPVKGQSWVVKRIISGKGFGPNASRKIEQIKVGSKWVDISVWKKAIYDRKNGKATKQQIRMLDKGHYRKKEK